LDLRTARLTGRRPTPEDAPLYESLLTASEVARWLRPPPFLPFTREEIGALLNRDITHWRDHGFGPWVVRETAGTFAGRAGLQRNRIAGETVVEAVWAIAPSCWGRGLGTEAAIGALAVAAELGIAEVVAVTLVDNHASRRVMEKSGFVLVGEIGHAGLPHLLFRSPAAIRSTPPGAPG
jgi:RimJ/RimL family protein N-acetyltransferase